MDLIERYLGAVGRELPASMREDVTTELRSAIEDGIEAKAAAEPGADRASIAAGVIMEFGPPSSIARSYMPEDRYLIGPRHYPGFKRTVGIVLGLIYAFAILGAVIYAIVMRLGLSDLWMLLITSHQRFLRIGFWALGVIVAIYFAVEKFGRDSRERTVDEEGWDPSTLPPVSARDNLNRTGVVITMCIYGLLFIIFNFFRQYLGIINISREGWHFLAILGPGFGDFLAMLNAWWLMAAVFGYVLLRQGEWRPWSRVTRIILDILLITILFYMAGSSDLLIGKDTPLQWVGSEAHSRSILNGSQAGLRIALYVGAAAALWGVVKKTWRLIKGKA